jgi:hypothetical protein
MISFSKTAVERAMKVARSEVAGNSEEKLPGGQRLEILGISDRHVRRWKERYEEFGYEEAAQRARYCAQQAAGTSPASTLRGCSVSHAGMLFTLESQSSA